MKDNYEVPRMTEDSKYAVAPNPEYRKVSEHEKEQTQKKIANSLAIIARGLTWLSAVLSFSVMWYAFNY